MVRCYASIAVVGISALCLAGMAGCAKVSVYRIKNENGVETVDKSVSGIRFYRPRPYVSVNESFPIAATTYIARGRMSPDGKYLIIERVPDTLKTSVAIVDGAAAVEATRVMVPAASSGASAQGGTDGAASDTGKGSGGSTSKPSQSSDDQKPPAKQPGSGMQTMKSTNDPNAHSVIAGRRYFDIIFLPDFDENYVVDVKPGLGNSSATVNLGEGWSLQGVDATVDNSRITEPILDLFGDSLKVLTELGKRAVGIPPLPGGAAAQAGNAATELKAGQEVSIRLTKVQLVAPGLYPILKPAEQAQLEAKYAANPTDARIQQIHVPLVNATNIAFNVYETVLIEAIPTTGDSTYRLLQYGGAPPTGTGQTSGAGGSDQGGAGGTIAEQEQKIQKALSGQVKHGDTAIDFTVKIDPSDGSVTVTAPDGTALTAADKTTVTRIVKQNYKQDATVNIKP